MALINISGKIGSGKDTAAKIIQILTSKSPIIKETFKEVGIKHMLDTYNKNISKDNELDNFEWSIKRHADKLKQILALVCGVSIEKFEDEEFKSSIMPDEWQIYTIYRGSKEIISFATFEEADDYLSKTSNSSYYEWTWKKSQRTYRWALQYMGTDLFRDKFHPNFHLNALYSDYKIIDIEKRRTDLTSIDYAECFPKWIVPDTRFINEIEKANKFGSLTIRIDAKVYWWKTKTGKLVYTRTPFFTDDDIIDSGSHLAPSHQSEVELDDYSNFKYKIRNDGTIEELCNTLREILIKEKII